MSIQFNCSSCNSVLKIAEEHVGRKLKCPQCQTVMTVPSPEQAAAPKRQSLTSLPSDLAAPKPATAAPAMPAAPVAPVASPIPMAAPSQGGSPVGASAKSVNAKQHVAPGTGFHSMVANVVFVIVVLVSVVSTAGMALVFWLIGLLTLRATNAKAEAALKASAIAVGPQQFPAIYQSANRISQQLGVNLPTVYVMESNDQNAFAVKNGSKHNIVLIDDIVFGAQATGDSQTLDFIIAHELAHHALGHTKLIRGIIRQFYRPLSRLDEFSCDAVAADCLQNTDASLSAMTLLAVGPQLYPQVNQQVLRTQVEQVMANKKTKKSEAVLTHPHILRRYGAILGMKI